ncbi:response regulator [Haloferula sp. A504]|uniref:response regulator n=1 Tax=Haloferula sp. A504 TaxID=3373601 RepID=UPI0031BF3A26|nr:response regulator transcription factor [Verrucomicrobiaceae bacterium E54]
MKTTENPIRVWLVEDNALFATSVQRVVESLENMQCEAPFVSVEAAFEALDSSPAPDVILLDVQLPGLDGISALESFRERAPEARVLILTVFDDAEKIFRAVCAGAAGYVLKSSGIDMIGSAIRQVVEGGAPMSPAVARKVLDAFPRLQPLPAGYEDYELTEREMDILRLLADGLQKKEIAMALEISTHTVSTHLRRVYTKLHVTTNTGAVAKALRERII